MVQIVGFSVTPRKQEYTEFMQTFPKPILDDALNQAAQLSNQ